MFEEKEVFSRTGRLLGTEAMEQLKNSRVAVFGIGGVGGHVAEALARCGVGALDLIDHDRVALSNINRQIIATLETVGMLKVEAMKERIASINPGCRVFAHPCFYLPDTAPQFDFSDYDYVVDAVDTVTAKLAIVMAAKEKNVPVISSMGAGNKLDPTRFEVADIYQTSVCPLARVMRQELRKRGVRELKVVYSKEEPIAPIRDECEEEAGKAAPGSIAFVPSVAGLIIAGEVVKDLTNKQRWR